MASTPLHRQPWLSCTGFPRGSLLKKHKFRNHHRHCLIVKAASGSGNLGCQNKRISSFRHRSSSNVPLRELPGAPFDQYLEDKGRVIRAIFPTKSTSRQLNEEEWRVKLTPIQVLFLTCQPVIDVTARCICNSDEDYPPEIPGHVTKFLDVKITSCELQGLHADYLPSDIDIKARGALYLEKQGRRSLVKNQLDINFTLVLPQLLAWVPEYVLQNILQSILRSYVEDINEGFAVRLIADYESFKGSTSKK